MMKTDAELALMTASAYALELNSDEDSLVRLTTDGLHWAGYGIFTGLELALYLDECAYLAKEERKAWYAEPFVVEPVTPDPMKGWYI
jgi:hypothetical protein